MSRYYYYNRHYQSSESQHHQRIRRAFEQPLQLVRCRYFPGTSNKWEIHISSSTGSGSYLLNFTSKTSSCNCPDFDRRQKPCKHMLCVLLRILKLRDSEFTTVTQVGKSYEEITQSFLKLFHVDQQQLTANSVVTTTLNEGGKEGNSKKGKKRKTTSTKKGKKRKVTEEQDVEDDKEEEAVKTESSAPQPSQQQQQQQQQQQVEEAAATTIATSSTAVAQEEMCIICLLEFQTTEENITKCSSHCQRWLGHQACVNTWFIKSPLCPLCKGPQQQPKHSSSSSSAYKRPRYGYGYSHGGSDDNEVDINALQEQIDGQESISPDFFEIVRD